MKMMSGLGYGRCGKAREAKVNHDSSLPANQYIILRRLIHTIFDSLEVLKIIFDLMIRQIFLILLLYQRMEISKFVRISVSPLCSINTYREAKASKRPPVGRTVCTSPLVSGRSAISAGTRVYKVDRSKRHRLAVWRRVAWLVPIPPQGKVARITLY
jgi:hypothetical protein